MKIPIPPFLTSDPASLSHGTWRLQTPTGSIPLADDVPDWDYQTTLTLETEIVVHLDDVLQNCGLLPTSRLAVVITAASDHTRTERRVLLTHLTSARGSFTVPVKADLVGTDLGGRLTLRTLLVVLDPHPAGPLSATEPASILWRHEHRVFLEGSAGQFPTDAEDFTRTRPQIADAGWFLRVDLDDPEAPFLQAVRLTLNTSNPRVAALLTGANDAGTQSTVKLMDWDVTRQLVTRGLEIDEVILASVDSETESLTGVLRNLIATIWPSTSPTTIREWRDNDPERFESHLLSYGKIP